MEKIRYSYIIKIQYLGFRYSGWQKQPHQKTIEQMILKTLKYVLPERKMKILGASRTDAKVSALDGAFELFLEEKPLGDMHNFLLTFNKNLPPDIRATEVLTAPDNFNIIQGSKLKVYMYLFAFGEKNHPFCAPFLANFITHLDIEQMKKAAKLFEGKHDFSVYTARLQKGTQTERVVGKCEIVENNFLRANFFPKKSYALIVEGTGFMRYQVRMIMGALIQVGEGKLPMQDIKLSLQRNSKIQVKYVAPGSGLHLKTLDFNF